MPQTGDVLFARWAVLRGRLDPQVLQQGLEKRCTLEMQGHAGDVLDLLLEEGRLEFAEVAGLAKELSLRSLRCPGCGLRQAAAGGGPDEPPPCPRCGGERLAVPPSPLDSRDAVLDLIRTAVPALAEHINRSVHELPEYAAGLSPLDLPEQFGRYVILGKLGQGGMGAVYKAKHRELGRQVALKVLSRRSGAGPEEVRRFQREAKSAARLRHPNIVAIHDVGNVGDLHYFTMDFIEGQTLSDLLKGHVLSLEESARMLAGVADGIHEAHQQGIIHRDLKPANILVDGAKQPFVTDFGLAKETFEQSQLTLTGAVMGTPHYMSPEQAQGLNDQIDARTDVWALGAILYHALTGQPPFTGANISETLRKVVTSPPVPPRQLKPRIPRAIEAICLKALEKLKARRYRSAKDLADDLRRFLAGEPVKANPTGRVRRAIDQMIAHPGRVAAAFVAVAMLAAAVVGLVRMQQAGALEARRQLEATRNRDLSQGETDLLAGNVDAALKLAEAILAQAPGHPRALVLRGRCALVQGREARARQDFRDAVAAGPAVPEARLQRGMDSLREAARAAKREDQSRLLDEAVVDLDEAVRLTAGAMGGAGYRAERARQFAEAWRLFPSRVDLLGRAAEDAESVVRSEPSNDAMRETHGRILIGLHRWTEARTVFHALFKRKHDRSMAAQAGLALLGQGLLREAADWIPLAGSTAQAPPAVLEFLARVRYARGEFSDANVAAGELTERFKDLAAGFLIQARYAHDRGDLAEADRLYQMAIEREIHNPEALGLYADLLADKGDADTAVHLYDRALENLPPGETPGYEADVARWTYRKGWVQTLRGEPGAAEGAWNRAMTLRPDWRLFEGGLFYGTRADVATRVQELAAEVDFGNPNLPALRRLAEFVLQSGDAAGAVADYTLWVSKAPEDPEALLGLGLSRVLETLQKAPPPEISGMPVEPPFPPPAEFLSILKADRENDVAYHGVFLRDRPAEQYPQGLQPVPARSLIALFLASFARPSGASQELPVILEPINSAGLQDPVSPVLALRRAALALESLIDGSVRGDPAFPWTPYENAWILCNRAVRAAPNHPAPYFLRAVFWQSCGESLLASNWTPPPGLAAAADVPVRRIAYSLPDMEAAIRRGMKGLEYQRSQTLVGFEKWADAAGAYTKVLESRSGAHATLARKPCFWPMPTPAAIDDVLQARAVCFLQMKMPKDAEADITARLTELTGPAAPPAPKLPPDLVRQQRQQRESRIRELYRMRVEARVALDDLAGAEKDLDTYWALCPENDANDRAWAKLELAKLRLRQKRYREALSDARDSMTRRGVEVQAAAVVLECLLELKDHAGAWDEVRQRSMQSLQWVASIRINGREVTLDEHQKRLVGLIQRLERESGRTVRDVLGPKMGDLWEAIKSAQEGE